MPPALVLVPPALLAAAAVACWGSRRARMPDARVVAAASAWAAVLLEVTGGTSNYAAVPVTVLGPLLFMLLAVVAVLCSGVLPVGTWVPLIWTRARLEAGSVAVCVLVPLGFLLLVRAYGLGGGRWPDYWLNLALALLGTATALAAALRAQAAVDLRGYLAEAVPVAAGLALLSLSLGTPA